VSALLNDVSKRSRRKVGVVPSSYHDKKVVFDRATGAVLLLISLPILAVLLVLVRATSRGGALYRQRRVGKEGREFWLYKIRTMYQDAEALGGPQWAKPKDSRITPIGRALRFLHLDELPQLLNVVRGEMSLIGPRPERPEFVEQLALVIPNYKDRLGVLPGITGLAQINLPPDETTECVKKKVAIDCEYIIHGSAVLDLRILICTTLRMLGIRHGRAPRWLGVEYTVPARSPGLEETLDMSLDETLVGVPASANGAWAHYHNGKPTNGKLALEYVAVGAPESSNGGTKHAAKPRRPR
jgi:lipopolysaccharide/colanic/teichoic acid biosynthesis glycosyltransferase